MDMYVAQTGDIGLSDDIPHVTVSWRGGDYSVLSAIGDVLVSFPFWRTVIASVIFAALLVWLWRTQGWRILAGGAEAMDEHLHDRLPTTRKLGSIFLSGVVAVICAWSTYSLIDNTYVQGTGREYRLLAAETLRTSGGLTVSPGGIPDRSQDVRTTSVSRGTTAAETPCEVYNLDVDSHSGKGDYRLAVVCNDQPLNLGDNGS